MNSAWLAIMDPTIGPLEADKPINVTIPVQNTGATPGSVTVERLNIYMVPVNTPITVVAAMFEKMPSCASHRICSPKGTMTFVPDAITVSKDQIEAIAGKKMTLCVLVELLYLDTFQQPH